MQILDQFYRKRKQLAILVDPDKLTREEIEKTAKNAQLAEADYFFVGGSLLINDSLHQSIQIIKDNCSLPVVIFPGNNYQLSSNADAILFLSLISGRNPDMLIGMHVIAAPYIRLSGLESIATGYMLIDSGKPTSVSYMSNSFPIPSDKKDIAACTAMAGEMLGLKMIYMDAGSGAENSIPKEMIQFVKDSIDIPLVVGGGIKTPELLHEKYKAGADIAVIGTHFENNMTSMQHFTSVKSSFIT
ncbi:MAG: geranylgeranylglyceryl/heptaprenylglyceryl phosphate synthase [Marinilabiliales bacterium]|nr:MAG: geranylgeranylglyceryl/heptaprenylglyceryl phosphate synthase [Marinilabiliales bacterium]